jgi:hypothetical protein
MDMNAMNLLSELAASELRDALSRLTDATVTAMSVLALAQSGGAHPTTIRYYKDSVDNLAVVVDQVALLHARLAGAGGGNDKLPRHALECLARIDKAKVQLKL